MIAAAPASVNTASFRESLFSRVGVVFWQPGDGLSTGYCSQIRGWGLEAVEFLWNEPLPPGLDVVLVHGPLGSMAPLAAQLCQLPPAFRPGLAFLMTEQLPNPGLPEWLRYGGGRLRSWLERLAYQRGPDGEWLLRPGWGRVVGKAHRYRYYGDLFWLRREGLLSALAVWSYWTADFLRRRGFDPMIPTRGASPNWGADLKLERDIPVLWLGKIATDRRGRLLRRVRAELAARGVELYVVNGVENPYVFGQERTVLLNRTRIMLNLLREPWDDNSMRYVLAAHNGALIVSEPTLPHSPYLPGVHRVEAPVDRLAETICYYLEHEPERQEIVGRAYRLVHEGAPGGKGLYELLERAYLRRGDG